MSFDDLDLAKHKEIEELQREREESVERENTLKLQIEEMALQMA